MRFFFHTYGCQMNVRDSEAAAAALAAAGHSPAASEEDADLVVVNSCSVRAKAEEKALGKLGLLCSPRRARPGRIVGLMGCMAQRLGRGVFDKVPGLAFAAGTRRAGAVPRLAARALAGERGISEFSSPDAPPDAPSAHLPGGVSAFVTILLGCNRRCAYCIVPDVRGREYSRPANEILAEIRALARGGVREVTLLGQSVMNYGRTNPVWDDARGAPSPGGFREPFARLLEAAAAVPGILRVRFTSGHPSGCTGELVRAFASIPKLCPHLHLPVQSGSDAVLKAMRRGYTREGYLKAAAALRAAVPGFALTTDVIVGFPGETGADFEETRSLMEAAAFDNAFIFKYSPRPGTPSAARPDNVPDEEKRRRNRVLLNDQDARGAAINAALVGSVQEVLAEGPSLRDPARWAGRSPGNKIVIFEPPAGMKPGALARVSIERALPQTLYGKVRSYE